MRRDSIRDFSPGLLTHLSAMNLPDGGSPDVLNLVVSRSTLEVRPGRVEHSVPPVGATGAPRAIFEYVPPTGNVRLVVVYGTDIYITDTSTQDFGVTGLQFVKPTLDNPLHASNPIRAAQGGDNLYLVDGSNRVRKIVPALTCSELKPTYPAPTSVPTVTVSNRGGTDYLLPGEYEFAFVFEGANDTGPRGTAVTYNLPATDQRQLIITLPAGIETQLAALAAAGEPLPSYVSVCVRSPYSTGLQWYRLQQIAVTGSPPVSAYIPGAVVAHAGDYIHDIAPVGVPGAHRLGNTVTLTTTTPHGSQVGQYVTVDDPTGFELHVSFWGTFQVATVPSTTSLTYAQVAGDLDSGGGVVERTMSVYTILTAARVGNVVTITTDGPHEMPVGTYVSIAGVVPVGATVFNGFFPITSTPTLNTFTYDQVAVDDTGAGGTAIPIYRTQVDSSTLPVMMDWLDSPPTGASLILEWESRMVYGYGSYLYLSNTLDPEHVPVETNAYSPVDYGGMIRVGEDEALVRALAKVGSYLLVYKAPGRGIWALAGRDWNSFDLQQITPLHGVRAQEGVVSDGSNAYYLDQTSVFRVTGQMIPQDIGLAVYRLVPVYGATRSDRLDGVRLVLDPITQRLEVLFGAS